MASKTTSSNDSKEAPKGAAESDSKSEAPADLGSEPGAAAPEPAIAHDAPEPEAKSSAAPSEAAPAKDEGPIYAEVIPPRALPKLAPSAASPAPGLAPAGDARSFRRSADNQNEFCLVYRWHRELVVRRGVVGTYGEVTVMDYPTERQAAHAYAKKCSAITGEGFTDLRE